MPQGYEPAAASSILERLFQAIIDTTYLLQYVGTFFKVSTIEIPNSMYAISNAPELNKANHATIRDRQKMPMESGASIVFVRKIARLLLSVA